MSLATVAYCLASNPNFASMLQESPDLAIAKAGIQLSDDDQMILRSIVQIPGNVIHLIESIDLAEPWAVGG
jgi:hypothetical protein